MILVIKLGALGDFILADPAFKAIRDHHPNEKVVLLTTPSFEGLANKLGYFDEVFALPRFRYFDIKNWLVLRRFFNAHAFDTVYDLQMVGRTARYYSFLKLFAQKPFTWVGHVKASPYCLEKSYFKKHTEERFKRLLGKVQINSIPPLDLTRLAEPIDVEELKRPYVLVIPSASHAYGGAKIWPLEFYRDIVRHLTGQGYQVVVIGGPTDDHTLLRINDRVIDMTGKTTLPQIIDLAQHASFAFGGDTGPMHMAAASKCPVFQLFSLKVLPSDQVGARAPHYYHFETDDLKTLHPDEVWDEIQLFITKLKNIKNSSKTSSS